MHVHLIGRYSMGRIERAFKELDIVLIFRAFHQMDLEPSSGHFMDPIIWASDQLVLIVYECRHLIKDDATNQDGDGDDDVHLQE